MNTCFHAFTMYRILYGILYGMADAWGWHESTSLLLGLCKIVVHSKHTYTHVFFVDQSSRSGWRQVGERVWKECRL